MNRRHFLTTTLAATTAALTAGAAPAPSRRILLRSSWQTANIGDIAHTPGMLALLEQHYPDATVTVWPKGINDEVEGMLTGRFPKPAISTNERDAEAALGECNFFLHGAGPGLVGKAEAERARQAGKPYGFAGITLSDDEFKSHRELLAGAKFVFSRDTDSLRAFEQSGIKGPQAA